MVSSTQRLSSLGQTPEGKEGRPEAACRSGSVALGRAEAGLAAANGEAAGAAAEEEEEAVPPLGEAYMQLWRVVRLPTVQASRAASACCAAPCMLCCAVHALLLCVLGCLAVSGLLSSSSGLASGLSLLLPGL
jgi:hypothetical protein